MNIILGSDLVNWLFENIDGFVNRDDARNYASSMLKAGYIRHPVISQHFLNSVIMY